VCDVRDGAALGALVNDVYAHYGRIDGVIHGAGVIHDQLVRDKRLDTFESVLATKVDGALALATRLRPAGLRFLVFFSSVAARFGNRGQADYAAANEVLNKLAQDLDRRWPGRVVSINWGPWLSGGMISPEVQRQFTSRGIELIPPAAGCRSLDREICSTCKGEAEVVIGARRVPSAAVAVADPPRREFPLLGPDVELVRHADGSGELLHTLDVGRDAYLNDHRLDGRPVLPFAMALELMAEAAGLGWPQLEVTTVSEQRVLQGISLRGPRQSIRVVVRPRAKTVDGLAVDVAIVSAEDSGRRHYQAVVELGAGPRGSVSASSIPTLQEPTGPLPIGIAAAYREWLFHGPLFQAIVSVEAIGPAGARAMLRPSDPGACLGGRPAGDWLIDPIVIDSALQMQVLWARLHWDVTLLPASIGAFRRVAQRLGRAGGVIQHELRVRPESHFPNCHVDHYFYTVDTAERQLLGVLTNSEGIGSKALNRLAGVAGDR
jgi:hypothetical protein